MPSDKKVNYVEVLNWKKYNYRPDIKNPSWFRLNINFLRDEKFEGLRAETILVWIQTVATATLVRNQTVSRRELDWNWTGKRQALVRHLKSLENAGLVKIHERKTNNDATPDLQDTNSTKQNSTQDDVEEVLVHQVHGGRALHETATDSTTTKTDQKYQLTVPEAGDEQHAAWLVCQTEGWTYDEERARQIFESCRLQFGASDDAIAVGSYEFYLGFDDSRAMRPKNSLSNYIRRANEAGTKAKKDKDSWWKLHLEREKTKGNRFTPSPPRQRIK